MESTTSPARETTRRPERPRRRAARPPALDWPRSPEVDGYRWALGPDPDEERPAE